MLNTNASNAGSPVRDTVGHGCPEIVPIVNRDPKGAEPDVRHDFCTPGHFDKAQHRSMAGLVGN